MASQNPPKQKTSCLNLQHSYNTKLHGFKFVFAYTETTGRNPSKPPAGFFPDVADYLEP